MPMPVIIIICCFIPIMIAAIVVSIIRLKNVNQHLSKTIDGHLVEISIIFTVFSLIIDKKVVDQLKSYKVDACKLSAKVDNLSVVVNIGSAVLKPKIITFVNGTKDNELSND